MVGKSARTHWSYDGSGFPLDKEKARQRVSQDAGVAVLGKLSKCCFSWNKNLWYTVYVSSMTSDVAVSPVWNLVHRQQ